MAAIRSSAFALCLLSVMACRLVPKTQTPQIEPVVSSKSDPHPARPKGLLDTILADDTEPFARVFRHPDTFNLQIIFTQVDRLPDGKVSFTEHVFGPEPRPYFYPASTVKLPVAILALQRLREMGIPGVDRNTTMLTGAAYAGQTPVNNDPSTEDGRPTIAHYIKKILLVSDNDAYNRLYEFLGPDYINRELHRRGYDEAEIIHRLEIPLNEDQNRHTNPVRFIDRQGRTLFEQGPQFSTASYGRREEKLGRGYMQQGVLRKGPMDFSRKNRIGLSSLHHILRAVMYPASVPAKERFNLGEDDLRFLREYMSATPASAEYPPYDRSTYYDTYCKFLYFGSDRSQVIPPSMKVYNKVGDAYGHLLDIACFEDTGSGVGFLLSAVVYCNSDGILNDDRYDYDSMGFPLMAYIGKKVFAYETTRTRKK
jgi:hypothetical protein